MIFLGDIASPDSNCSKALELSLEKASNVFLGKSILANLEGVIANYSTHTETPVLFNHPSVITVLKKHGAVAFSLANNHTLDLPEYYDQTTEALDKENISFAGAARSKEAAYEPARFETEGVSISFFASCWKVMLQHQENPNQGVHVATINENKILELIRQERKNFPNNKIVFMPHWNLDLETAPFPIHRVFAKACIDAGANAVIGSHSHCVQGIERYNNGVIAYSLGNFFIPWGTFIKGTIHFPEFSKISLALEWNPVTNEIKTHWFEYNDDGSHALKLIASEDFDNSQLVKKYTPYSKFNEREYVSWYLKNRRKKKFIPVYKSHDQVFRNNILDFYLMQRIKFARFLAKSGLRNWNN